MTTQMNATYINALLADASYVNLTNPDGSISPDETIKSNLKERLTEPLANLESMGSDSIDFNSLIVNGLFY